jgi:hypothetical protein
MNEALINRLRGYITSANGVPVSRVTIPAEDLRELLDYVGSLDSPRRRYIFSFIDPEADEDEDVRWIAAKDQAQADAYAGAVGWVQNGTGAILSGTGFNYTDAQLRETGCDTVL